MFQYNKSSENFYRSGNMIKKRIITILTIICITFLCSCHTTHGIGKDIESVGESIQKATD